MKTKILDSFDPKSFEFNLVPYQFFFLFFADRKVTYNFFFFILVCFLKKRVSTVKYDRKNKRIFFLFYKNDQSRKEMESLYKKI